VNTFKGTYCDHWKVERNNSFTIVFFSGEASQELLSLAPRVLMGPIPMEIHGAYGCHWFWDSSHHGNPAGG